MKAVSVRQSEEGEGPWESVSPLGPQGHPQNYPAAWITKGVRKRRHHRRSKGEKGIKRNKTPSSAKEMGKKSCGQILHVLILNFFLLYGMNHLLTTVL